MINQTQLRPRAINAITLPTKCANPPSLSTVLLVAWHRVRILTPLLPLLLPPPLLRYASPPAPSNPATRRAPRSTPRCPRWAALPALQGQVKWKRRWRGRVSILASANRGRRPTYVPRSNTTPRQATDARTSRRVVIHDAINLRVLLQVLLALLPQPRLPRTCIVEMRESSKASGAVGNAYRVRCCCC